MADDIEKLREDIANLYKDCGYVLCEKYEVPNRMEVFDCDHCFADQILSLEPIASLLKSKKKLLMAEGYMEMAKEAARVDTLREVEDISWVETINYKNPKRVMYETEWETLKCREQDVRTQRD